MPTAHDFPRPLGTDNAVTLGPGREINIPSLTPFPGIQPEEEGYGTVGEMFNEGSGFGLYVWGVLSYEDIFGVSQTHEYCLFMQRKPKGGFLGSFINGRNSST